MSTTTTETQTAPKNGELKKAFTDLVGALRSDPKSANLTVSVSSKLTDGLVANVKARDFEITVDEPPTLGGTDTGPNPVEYVLAGLASCQQIAIKAHATVLGIDVQEVTVEAEGDLDLQGFLGLSDARPGFTNVTFTSTIKTNETSEAKLKKLEKFAAANCPVLDIIKNDTPVNGKVAFTN